MIGLPDSILGWVQVIAVPLGVAVNGIIAFVAVRAIWPKRQKLAAYLIHEVERTSNTSVLHKRSIELKNLGPRDVVEVKDSEIPDNQWLGGFADVLYPTIHQRSTINYWEEFYIPVGGETRIHLAVPWTASTLQKETEPSGDELMEALTIEYKPLRGNPRRANVPLSFLRCTNSGSAARVSGSPTPLLQSC